MLIQELLKIKTGSLVTEAIKFDDVAAWDQILVDAHEAVKKASAAAAETASKEKRRAQYSIVAAHAKKVAGVLKKIDAVLHKSGFKDPDSDVILDANLLDFDAWVEFYAGGEADDIKFKLNVVMDKDDYSIYLTAEQGGKSLIGKSKTSGVMEVSKTQPAKGLLIKALGVLNTAVGKLK